MPLVFTYGPDAAPGKMRDRIVGTKLIGGALLEDHRLVFNKPNVKSKGEGLPNVAPEEGAKVFGLVTEVPAAQMDLLDGFFGGYGRKNVTINMKGETMEAGTWFARRTGNRLKPSKETIEQTRQALEESGAPRTFIEELEEVEVLDE